MLKHLRVCATLSLVISTASFLNLQCSHLDQEKANEGGRDPKELTFKRILDGNAKSADGTRLAIHTYMASDGVRVALVSETHPSASSARLKLAERVKDAREVIIRGSKLDRKGKEIGERVVIRFRAPEAPKNELAAVIWTEGRYLRYLESQSLHHVLELENKLYR